MELLREMRDRDLKSDVITYSAAISAKEKCEEWTCALELFGDMWDPGLEPNEISYSAGTSACEKGEV